MELWAYIIGLCLFSTNECVPKTAVMDFSTKQSCEIHAILITHIYSQRLQIDNPDSYSSYVGCIDQNTFPQQPLSDTS